MAQKTRVFDLATLTRLDAVILEEYLYCGYQAAITLTGGHYYVAIQIDREHGLCINSRDHGILTTYVERESKHVICHMRNRDNPYCVPALYETSVIHAYSTLDEAIQAIKKYLI